MARYIDADSTVKAIRDKFNIYFEIPCDSDDRRVQEIIGKVKNIIQEQPTADVVPKSEVEELKGELAIAERHEKDARALFKDAVIQLQNTKAEFAREIFEEIERMCIDTFGNFNHRVFAELKKKYIPQEPMTQKIDSDCKQ